MHSIASFNFELVRERVPLNGTATVFFKNKNLFSASPNQESQERKQKGIVFPGPI